MHKTLSSFLNVENCRIYQDFKIQEPKNSPLYAHQATETLKFKFIMKNTLNF